MKDYCKALLGLIIVGLVGCATTTNRPPPLVSMSELGSSVLIESYKMAVGDQVQIVSSRPLSRLKRWRVEKILKRAKGS